MKRLIKSVSFAALFCLSAISCQEEEQKPVNANVTLSPNAVVLLEDNNDQDALTISWDDFANGSEYTVLIANLYSVEWNNAYSISASGTSVTLTVKELEYALLGIGRESGSDAYIKVMVQAGGKETEFVPGSVRLYIPAVKLNTPVTTLEGPTDLVLSLDSQFNSCFDLSWTSAALETAACSYVFEMTDEGDDSFSNVICSMPLSGLSLSLKQLDLEYMMLKAGLESGTAHALIYRVRAIPDDRKVVGSVSETSGINVTAWTRPTPPSITSMQVVGSGVAGQWSMDSDASQGVCEDAEKGIWSWTGHINDNGGTFKVMFNKSWSKGVKHSTDNDYYWEGAFYAEDIGDNDYFVVIPKGDYKIIYNASTGLLSYEIIKLDYSTVTLVGEALSNKWDTDSGALASQNESNTVFKGNITITDNTKDFQAMFSDWNRYYISSGNQDSYAMSWKLSETKYKDDPAATGRRFKPTATGTYVCTFDLINNTLVLNPQ